MLAWHKTHNLDLITQHLQRQIVHLHALGTEVLVGLNLEVSHVRDYDGQSYST